MRKIRIAVLISGGGTNLQALIDAQKNAQLASGEICLVISSRPGAYALERAAAAGIPALVVSRKEIGSQQAFEEALLAAARNANPEKIVIKRPVKGPYLAGVRPDYSLGGKAVRYDCIVIPPGGKKI